MLCRRIIPCLDVKNGRVVKGTNFMNLQDAGDPVALARYYYGKGADELIFLDISASIEKRATIVELAQRVSEEVFIPFTIGGGISSINDMEKALKAGADKVALNTAALRNPRLIRDAAWEFGTQAIVVAIDAKKENGAWHVYSYGGKEKTNLDAIGWAKEVAELGAGELLITSIDRDGTKKGFDIVLLAQMAKEVSIPVIASGGAGEKGDFLDVFTKTRVTGALAASAFHYKKLSITKLKRYLAQKGVLVREN